ncbi:MAG: LysR family transcriptional regulator [Hyphomicrobiales bacterium]
MALDLKRLRAYRAWMQTGSVSQAAAKLGITQPAVSRLLHDLSDALRVPLFQRQGRNLVPTRESIALYAEVDQILEKVAGISDISNNLRRAQARQIHIAATPAPALGILPCAVKAFVRDFPDVEVAVDMCMPRDLHEWTTVGPFDIGLALMPMAHPDAIIKPLVRVDAVVGVPPDHPLAQCEVVTRSDLRHFPAILPPRYSLICAQWQAALRVDKREDVMDLFTSSSLSACQWAAAGLGVAVVDPLSTIAAGLGLVFRPVKPPLTVEYIMIFPRDQTPSRLVDAFVTCLRATVDQANLTLARQ